MNSSERAENQILTFVLFLIGVILVAGCWWMLPRMYLEPIHVDTAEKLTLFQRVELENHARWAVILIFTLAGIFLVIGLTLQRLATLEMAVGGQTTDALSKAIDQLSRSQSEQRLGGIYALERIARISAKDHGPVMQILSAYVRDNARINGEAGSEPGSLRPDIQAALTVIGRRNMDHEGREVLPIDLSGTDLRKADLRNAHLGMATLSGCLLDQADLSHADLSHADLKGTSLKRADFNHAKLHRARLHGADLTSAYSVARRQLNSAQRDEKTQVPANIIEC